MKGRIAGIFLILLALTAALGLAAADAEGRAAGGGTQTSDEVRFVAELQFDAAMDDHVKLVLTNQGSGEMRIAPGARYMDHLGTAGSWGCSASDEQIVEPGQTLCVEFHISEIVAHGNRSILAFFFQYNGCWYLGKVGEDNGVEYFLQHD